MTECLAIVGASVRAAAASAVRAGFEVVAADLFADLDLLRVARATRIGQYPGGFLDWLRALDPKPAGWMYTGGLENHPELVDAMSAECPLLGIGGEALRRVRSPLLLENLLQEAGMLFPETRRTADGLPRDGSWLVKTGRGASGSGVRVLDSTADHSTLERECVFQRRVAGTCCSAMFVAAGGVSRLLGIARQLIGEKWLNAGEFQYCGAIAPFSVSRKAEVEIANIGRRLVAEFCLRGLFGVDLIVDGDDVWTIEVNPRYTASVEVLERVTGANAIEVHAAACRDDRLWSAPAAPIEAVHSKAIIFSRENLIISETLARWEMEESKRTPWPALADISPAGSLIAASRPVVTTFAVGASHDESEINLKLRVANVERALYGDRPGH